MRAQLCTAAAAGYDVNADNIPATIKRNTGNSADKVRSPLRCRENAAVATLSTNKRQSPQSVT
jgi:hypothetical protein